MQTGTTAESFDAYPIVQAEDEGNHGLDEGAWASGMGHLPC